MSNLRDNWRSRIAAAVAAAAGGLMLQPPAAPAQPPAAPAPVRLRIFHAGLGEPDHARISIVATSKVHVSHELGLYERLATLTVPANRGVLAVDATITNESPFPIDEESLIVGDDISGVFDMPMAAYRGAFGGLETGDQQYSHRVSCLLSDIPIDGDCEQEFGPEYFGSADALGMLQPGESFPVTLAAVSNPLPPTVPADFDPSSVRVFLRNPRAERRRITGSEYSLPCTDPAHPPDFFASDTACELPLTLELRTPGETALPVTPPPGTPGKPDELGPGGPSCRISGENSQSKVSVDLPVSRLLGVRLGSTSDVEKSYREDKLWWVTLRSGSSGALTLSPKSVRAGPLARDIEASGGLTFAHAATMRFGSQDEAAQVIHDFNGDLQPGSAEEKQTGALARRRLASSYSESGVDLAAGFGGSPGKVEVAVSQPRGVMQYRTGHFGIVSALNFSAGGHADHYLRIGSGLNAVQTSELDFDDQDRPTRLSIVSDATISGKLQPRDFTGTVRAAYSRVEQLQPTGELTASAAATVNIRQGADLTLPQNASAARELETALDHAPDRLPPDTAAIAQTLAAGSEYRFVASVSGSAPSGVNFGFKIGPHYALGFGRTATTESAIFASRSMGPGGPLVPWPECVPRT